MPKYKFTDASLEENQKFADAFTALLKTFPDLSVTTNIVKKSIVINLEDGKMETVFFDSPTLLIQKKIEIIEPEIVQEGTVLSTNPEVNPTINPINPQP